MRKWIRESLTRSGDRLDEGFLDSLKAAGEKVMGFFKGKDAKANLKAYKRQLNKSENDMNAFLEEIKSAKDGAALKSVFKGDAELEDVVKKASGTHYGREGAAKLALENAIQHAFMNSKRVENAFRVAANSSVGYYDKTDREERIATLATKLSKDAGDRAQIAKSSALADEIDRFDEWISDYGDPAQNIGKPYDSTTKGAGGNLKYVASEVADRIIEDLETWD